MARVLAVFGATTVAIDGIEAALRPREHDLLAAIAVTHPRPATLQGIIDAIWPFEPPPTARQTIQNHVSRVRSVFGADAIETAPGPTYRLGPGWTLDLERFDVHLAHARQAARAGDHAISRGHLRKALGIVRGAPFADLPDNHHVTGQRVRYDNARLAAEDEVVLTLLDDRDDTAAITDGWALATAEPFRETRWTMLALALYRDGQRRASLAALQRGRDHLRDIAGLDGGPAIQRLESMIFDDDPQLLKATPAALVGIDRRRGGRRFADGRLFVGRAAPLEAGRRLLSSVGERRHGVRMRVGGESGVGKTEFARRLAADARVDGWRVVETRLTRGRTHVLEPFGEIVRALLELEDDRDELFDQALRDDVGVLSGSGESVARGDPGEAAIELIGRHAARHPTLIVVDDAQHLSPSAAHLLRRVGSLPVPVVVLSVGDGADAERDPADVVAVDLGGLDVFETRNLLQALNDADVDIEMARTAQVATGGNPTALRRWEPDARRGKRAPVRLPPAAVEMAQVLAVAGSPLTRETITDVLGQRGSDVDAAVAAGIGAGGMRLDPDGRLALTDEAVASAALAGLAGEARADLDERLGEVLRRSGNVLAAAPHLLAVAARDPARAIDTARRAAGIAHRGSMYAEAAELLGDAARVSATAFGESRAETLELQLGEAEQRRLAGDPEHVHLLRDVAAVAEAEGHDVVMALAAAGLCKLGPLSESGMLDAELEALVERAIAGCSDPAARAECAGQATLFYSMSGKVDRCREYFDLALGQARVTGDDGAVMEALGNVYVSLAHPDDWELRAQLAAEMLMLGERLDSDDARFQALHVYFSTQVQFADPLLRTTFERQITVATALRSPGRRWMRDYHRAVVAFLDGRLDQSEEISTHNFTHAPVPASRAAAVHFMNLLVVRIAQGREQELRPQIDPMIAAQPGTPGWRAVVAWLAALAGDGARVGVEYDALDGGHALPRDQPWSGAMVWLGRAVAATRDVPRSRAMIPLLAPYSGLMTWYGSGTVGPFDQALAELSHICGDDAAARRYLAGAQRSVDRLQARVFQADIDRLAAQL